MQSIPRRELLETLRNLHRRSLLERAGSAFTLQNVVMELALKNVTIINDRAENNLGGYGLITTRAFAGLKDMLALTKNIFNQSTLLVAMKGVYPLQELAELEEAIERKELELMVEKVAIPFLNEERHLVLVEKK